MLIHIKYVKPALTRGSLLMTVEDPGQAPKSGPGANTITLMKHKQRYVTVGMSMRMSWMAPTRCYDA